MKLTPKNNRRLHQVVTYSSFLSPLVESSFRFPTAHEGNVQHNHQLGSSGRRSTERHRAASGLQPDRRNTRSWIISKFISVGFLASFSPHFSFVSDRPGGVSVSTRWLCLVSGSRVFVHTAPGCWCRAHKSGVLLFTSDVCVCVCVFHI